MEYFELGGGEGDEALLPQIFWADLQTRANQQLLHYECQECPEIVKINHLPINWGGGELQGCLVPGVLSWGK